MRDRKVSDHRLYVLLVSLLVSCTMGVACTDAAVPTPARSTEPLGTASGTVVVAAYPSASPILLPTATVTCTPVPTRTTTPTPSLTVTLTPSMTPTPSITPTPVSFDLVLDAYPLRPGNRWVWYVEFDEEAEWTETQVNVSRTVAIITDTVASFEVDGPVALASVAREGDPRPRARTQLYYVLTENQVIEVWDASDLSYYKSWFVDDLASQVTYTLPIDYQFPLVDGDLYPFWGWDPEWPYMYAWHVVAMGHEDAPAGSFEDCFQLYLVTGPDTTIRDFCPGIGPVQGIYSHHGEVDDRRWVLIGYQLNSEEPVRGPTPTPRPTYTPWVFATDTPEPTP